MIDVPAVRVEDVREASDVAVMPRHDLQDGFPLVVLEGDALRDVSDLPYAVQDLDSSADRRELRRAQPPRHRTRRATRSNPRDSNKRIDGLLSLGTAANTRSAPRDRKSRSDSWTSPRPEPIPRACGSTATKYTYPMGGVPRKRIPRGSPRSTIRPRPRGRARRGASRGPRRTHTRGRTRPGRSSR